MELEPLVLWGPDHVELGAIEARGGVGGVAVALGRGAHDKPYAYVDPNEDVVLAAAGPRARMLACADGHHGLEASLLAARIVVARLGADPPSELADEGLIDVFDAVNRAIVVATEAPSCPHPESATTLVVALVAGRRLRWASFGDSALVVGSARGGRSFPPGRPRFLGFPIDRDALAHELELGTAELADDEWVAAVTDGFTDWVAAPAGEALAQAVAGAEDRAPERVAQAPEDRAPERVARALVERAYRDGAGDNVGVALAAPHLPGGLR